jgi:ribonuclease P protein component
VPERLRRRSEFLNAAKGARYHAPAFSLQAIAREGGEGAARFGFTVTKKAGGAVERNRMRRRLREAVRRAAPATAKPGFDYVIVARRLALAAGFEQLVSDLERAIRLVGDKPARPQRRKPSSASKP